MWYVSFANKSIDDNVLIYNKTILNDLRNFIRHEVKFCDNKNHTASTKKNKTAHEK